MILTFDCYGTLIDTSPLLEEVGKMASEAGLSSDRAKELFPVYEARAMYAEPYCDYDKVVLHALKYLDFEFCSKVFGKQYDRAIECVKNYKAFPEVKDILAKMNCHLKELGHPFEYEILADETHCYKPNLEFFRYSEDMLGLKELPREGHCHIAEGYFWDIIPATYFRWNSIWVNRSRQQGDERGKDYIEVHELTGAYEALKKI